VCVCVCVCECVCVCVREREREGESLQHYKNFSYINLLEKMEIKRL